MQALQAVTIIRNWAIERCQGLALLDDTPRFNLLVAQIDGMAELTGRGGDKLEEDLHDIVFLEIPVQLDGHPSAIKALQEGFDDLMTKLQAAEDEPPAEQPAEPAPTEPAPAEPAPQDAPKEEPAVSA